MIKLNISISSIHIFKIMEWSKNQNIDFSYIKNNLHIIMYAYTFFENNYEHKLTICNDKITSEAMQECKNKNLIPYNNGYIQFPNEIIRPPVSVAETMYKNIVRWDKAEVGGHFAALEQPKLLSESILNFFDEI